MFGDVVFSTEDEGYTEYQLADEQGIRVTACFMSGTIKLFRIEWTEQDGYQAKKGVYSLLEAIAEFEGLISAQEDDPFDHPDTPPIYLAARYKHNRTQTHRTSKKPAPSMLPAENTT